MKNKLVIIIILSILVFAFIAFFLRAKKQCPLQVKSGKIVSVPKAQALAKQAEAKGDLIEAKSIYQDLINNFSESNEVLNWQKKTEELNIKLLFSPTLTANTIIYEVKPADTLNKIAKLYNTTVDLIKKSNNLNSDIISPGKKLKIWTAPFIILVDKSQNSLVLKTKDEEIIKTYIVSTGLNNSTPVGTYKIVEKIPNPPWFKPGAPNPIPAGSPENILGTRWLGLSLPSYGIHGTTEPQNLGKQVTQGCVRMSNQDVEELYAIVPKGTEVIIYD